MGVQATIEKPLRGRSIAGSYRRERRTLQFDQPII
jgi:hypothetical protein